MRNRFFEYTGGFPYLICDNKKVDVEIEADGAIPYSEEDGEYYFNIRKIVELESASKGQDIKYSLPMASANNRYFASKTFLNKSKSQLFKKR